jgi:iron(III) transport system substrate-binding protein
MGVRAVRATAWLRVALLILLLGCSTPAPTGAPPVPSAAPAADVPAWQREWESVLAEARKEGEVIVWGDAGDDARRHQKEAFEAAYPGIKVTHFSAPTQTERDSRFLQEREAGIAKVDVMISGSAGVNARVKPTGALQDVRPFLILPEVTDPKNWMDGEIIWVDEEQQYMLMSEATVNSAVAINEAVGANEIQSWWDLLNPKFKGKIVMTDPRQSGGGFSRTIFFFYTPELGPEFVRRFYSESGVTFSSDTRQNIEWVTSGRALVNVNPGSIDVVEAQKMGLNVRTIATLKVSDTKQASAFSASSGVAFVPSLDPLPHPNATKVYLNWFYGKAGQQALQDIRTVVSRRVDVPKDKLPQDLVPQPGVSYMNLNHYTATNVVQDMRDAVSRAYPQ